MSKQNLLMAMTFGAVLAACGAEDGLDTEQASSEAIGESEMQLSGSNARRERSQAIRDVAASRGLTNGVLLAGIAQVETTLSQCWSESTWACQGPYSASCNGPVLAGASDGPCGNRAGGIGMFQFDGGNYDQTLARDGHEIVELDGNIRHAVDFVANMVDQNIAGVNGGGQALAWINGISVVRGDARFEQWIHLLSCRYNGACSGAQDAKYRDATIGMLNELGAGFWASSAVGNDGCTELERSNAAAYGCACVDHQPSGGYCPGTGCTAKETSDCGAYGTACVDHKCSGGFTDGSGCTAKETNDCAAYGTACVDHKCSGGYTDGSGCTAKETNDCAAFGAGCVDHKCAGGFAPGTGCTAKETDNCASVGCECREHKCAGGFCPAG